jgi:hypothetical protein
VRDEPASDYEAACQLFHGPSGVIPLRQFSGKQTGQSGCPFAGNHSEDISGGERGESAQRQPLAAHSYTSIGASSPFATISIPFFNFLVRGFILLKSVD